MKKLLYLVPVLALLCGCAGTKLPSEDLEVLTKYASEIAVLKSNLPTNSSEKYDAVKKLMRHVDFSFTREVQTLDKIFNARDARVDRPGAIDHMIMFYFQKGNRSVRLCFYRYGDIVNKVEIIEK